MQLKMVLKDEYTTEKIMTMLCADGESIRSFATKVEVSNPYLSQIFRGVHKPSPPIAKRISQGFNLEVTQMFDIEIIGAKEDDCLSQDNHNMVLKP